MRIGIFFGGQSREREISFAGGRTVFDNLNKSLFEAVPIFIDSLGNFILLNWEYLYKGTIRDFYPPAQFSPESAHYFQIYIESLQASEEELDAIMRSVGTPLQPKDFATHFDFAFLALHGPYGEDGNIQGLLEWYQIPYSGSGVLPSAIGISKTIQKDLMVAAGFKSPSKTTISRNNWLNTSIKETIYQEIKQQIGLPMVIKSPHQGSSIGVSVLKEDNFSLFEDAINRSLFIKSIDLTHWKSLSDSQKRSALITLTDIREGIGLPAFHEKTLIHTPDALWHYLDQAASAGEKHIQLTSRDSEEQVLIESFIKGKEFSCIVIQQADDSPMALPPTEIIKGSQLFDYRSKYLPGMSRKITPIQVDDASIDAIRHECERLFSALHCQVYARIDGFITDKGDIFLNDPNTTSGMLPSSFFFHQAAEIGLTPSQFLTYIIRTSLVERIKSGKNNTLLRQQLEKLDSQIGQMHLANKEKNRVAVIMGGFSSERHISVESGRNIFEKLSSSSKYAPIPIFLTGNEAKHELYVLPVNIMLKDNADDIKEKVHAQLNGQHKHPKLQEIIQQAQPLTEKYTGGSRTDFQAIDYAQLAQMCDACFIALHGRPGEDGAVQAELEKHAIPYNGSGIASSQLTINKFDTNELLRQNGLLVADHFLVWEDQWRANSQNLIANVEAQFRYPFIVKPADDGCSSAVKKIKTREEFVAFTELMFRPLEGELSAKEVAILQLKANEEFPKKNFFVVETLIEKGNAQHFMEITGGLLTRYAADGSLVYEVFEPSEALATGEVLSLEEKFLAGEGQNITPARFSRNEAQRANISAQVRAELEKAARVLNVEGYARIDAFVKIYESGKVETYIIEVNSLPGMTPATCIFHQTAINGYKPYDFIDAILDFGMKRLHKTAHV
ncbi:D-alanine--D-alanine ligase [Cytophagales bacterium LB-30]|uniref:D-alanine--D-alanine ligase n=1 Tax=Shiella aurantiaca TaxID=3058365 RepID=A0ABT8F4M7_9BACT|nr:D-alanine--D-alanine ligase [Shiella aurantiaca]MDN4165224.1 D-alanine--D-alanine ligase [Shiella aurantiaca]